tara:strand:- start:400 stop:501 length:102 start_codon:yes stop_codon:yes gene_type:complete
MLHARKEEVGQYNPITSIKPLMEVANAQDIPPN